ncbi:MAG: glycosyltransferase family 4 protein [bacterium]|nr:glycosyltransferase family 4 protein [bacterium]
MNALRQELHVAQFVEVLEAGGAESLAIAIAGSLADRGHDSHLAVVRGGGPFQSRVPATVRFCDLGRPKCEAGQVARIADFLQTCRDLEDYLRTAQIDVLQTHLPKANFLGLCMAWRGVCRVYPTIHNNREFDYGDNAGVLRRWLRRAGYRAMVGSCSGMVAVSDKVRISLAEQLGLRGRRISRISVVSNGVALPESMGPDRRRAARRRWGVADDAVLIVGVGRLTRQKNFEALIEALGCVSPTSRPWHCIIAGEGDKRLELEELIRRLGLGNQVTLAGLSDHVDELLGAADIFCLTSLFEGLPLVLLEAMAHALPVVAFAIDGVAEVVSDGLNAVTVNVGDNAAFSKALSALIDDDERRVLLGAAGRRLIAERFNFATKVEELLAIYGADAKGL